VTVLPTAVSLAPPKYAVGSRVRLGRCRTALADYSGRAATVREVEIMYAETDASGHFTRRGVRVGGNSLPGGSVVSGDTLTITNVHGRWTHREHHWGYTLEVDGFPYNVGVDEHTIAGRL
jgi:hypothetical protein